MLLQSGLWQCIGTPCANEDELDEARYSTGDVGCRERGGGDDDGIEGCMPLMRAREKTAKVAVNGDDTVMVREGLSSFVRTFTRGTNVEVLLETGGSVFLEAVLNFELTRLELRCSEATFVVVLQDVIDTMPPCKGKPWILPETIALQMLVDRRCNILIMQDSEHHSGTFVALRQESERLRDYFDTWIKLLLTKEVQLEERFDLKPTFSAPLRPLVQGINLPRRESSKSSPFVPPVQTTCQSLATVLSEATAEAPPAARALSEGIAPVAAFARSRPKSTPQPHRLASELVKVKSQEEIEDMYDLEADTLHREPNDGANDRAELLSVDTTTGVPPTSDTVTRSII
mmetsp:Transcript_43600/g.79434  ORF Transcript_43600/g.79434 Transcript_43600/m.79434 type:complete len:344 (-) Transcript_43600:130-1161(-)